MAIKYHPQHLSTVLEQTYRILQQFSVNGIVAATPRQLMEALNLRSPAPLNARLKALIAIGVIEQAA
jgi:LexA DNA binding domain